MGDFTDARGRPVWHVCIKCCSVGGTTSVEACERLDREMEASAYRVLAHGMNDDGSPSWTLSASGWPQDRRPLWRRLLNLCKPSDRHDWHPVGFADWRCVKCGGVR